MPAARRRPTWLTLLALTVGLSASVPALANDRPFQVARTAVMDDDENTWSFESWAQRAGTVRGFSVEPEYSFSDGRSVQLELTRSSDRRGGQSGQEAEVEFKQRFNDIGRDGYGVGLSLALNTLRSQEEARRHGWGLRLPLSLALGDSGALLHLNLGLDKQSGDARRWVSALALEQTLFKRVHGFVELARLGSDTLAQVGVRHWLTKEKLALDLAVQQQRSSSSSNNSSDGHALRASGFVLGLGWYEL